MTSHNARVLVINDSQFGRIMGFITDEERQEPLRVGDIPSTFAFMRRKRHLSGSGVFFY